MAYIVPITIADKTIRLRIGPSMVAPVRRVASSLAHAGISPAPQMMRRIRSVEKSISQLIRGRTLIRSVPGVVSILSVMAQSIVIRLGREGTVHIADRQLLCRGLHVYVVV